MNVHFNSKALELAVMEYRVLYTAGDPVTPAAFGIAVAHLQERLNMSLVHAAELLTTELERLTAVDKLRADERQVERAKLVQELDLLNDDEKPHGGPE